MASPELELQGAIVSRLKADVGLLALINGVYDQPPDTAFATPKESYVTIGEAQFLRDDATCVSGGEVYLTMHAWSRKVGYPVAKQIADVVAESLHLAPLTLATNRLISIMHRQTRVFRDTDGLTSHAVIDFVANVEKP
ncbi:DUF3168 domain-containing protein [Sinorhizobium meliloti]|uniref:DUF3168 domain-containing protein n=1 Tax=Rhizobium meliloti TaxID=382 RepID=UPI000FD8E829|nr:DUF3168 domain-containing protein [Sinorhizobium meliloti]MDW9500264.1 DUF3168 domain-containing protein [Sinorhizobium meliloti]MDX0026919.1 DUF3168 domain-containing protein [Sinorhizobium meliloti]MDX0070409.1 DUF3168 domain-containing protein [Sinorhizobium meliloti]RVH66510.1 DUF3168 domain-containing protein [Sinorhizobium meliloti]RVK64551.1 DUF3168 domain-containing protein [Sinorhizobium meliloti]